MAALGRHLMIELYGCDFNLLNDVVSIEEILVEAALNCGAVIIDKLFYRFSPQGVSGVVMISESHLAIHTWPELGYAACDVFTCGSTIKTDVAVNYLVRCFNAQEYTVKEVLRGELSKLNAVV